MATQEQYAICLRMIEALSQHGSWCGETHIQKASYVMQTLGAEQKIWDFVLYKHGPYSFDLHATIDALKQMNFLTLKVNPPYGPQIGLSETGKSLLHKYSEIVAAYDSAIFKTAELLADKGVQQLEKIGTALLLNREYHDAEDDFLAQKINEIKPHISIGDAQTAVQSYRDLAKKFSTVS